MKISELADILVIFLKQKGIIIQRYDAVTTKSIYLKLDYGVCNTVRISDHRGKKHLKYRYNLQTNLKEYRTVPTGNNTHQLFYPTDQFYKMLRKIIKDRDKKLKRYGDSYFKFMESNKQNNNGNYGFWREAILV